jgi:hypothetical protein
VRTKIGFYAMAGTSRNYCNITTEWLVSLISCFFNKWLLYCYLTSNETCSLFNSLVLSDPFSLQCQRFLACNTCRWYIWLLGTHNGETTEQNTQNKTSLAYMHSVASFSCCKKCIMCINKGTFHFDRCLSKNKSYDCSPNGRIPFI